MPPVPLLPHPANELAGDVGAPAVPLTAATRLRVGVGLERGLEVGTTQGVLRRVLWILSKKHLTAVQPKTAKCDTALLENP